MKLLRLAIVILLAGIVAAAVYYAVTREPRQIVLSGIVTTDEVIVAPRMQGRLQQLLVKEGENVSAGQLVATLDSREQEAEARYYSDSDQQTAAQIGQAEADLEFARLSYERDKPLFDQHAVSAQDLDQARTSYNSALARLEALKKQREAARAQKDKAAVQLSYMQIAAPIAGVIDTRAALQGEVVNPGQAIVTIINQDDLWVRADVEETYIDRIHLGDRLTVKLPSGAERDGIVFYRGVDADYATQRDVSRTKRDIRTFEIRLRCDNHDRSLAVGMTAYVTLPLERR
jgi:HlyD family secretion protein